MTIVFSAASVFLISMTSDSAVTLDFEEAPREYTTGQKSFYMPGIGCLMTWGDQSQNHIARFLSQQNLSPATHSIEDVASLVFRYLTEDYRPHELGIEVGYHIAGFDRNRKPRLFHVFYGLDRPKPEGQESAKYELYDHSPSLGQVQYLYNGRNDLAEVMVHTLIQQIQSGKAVHPYLQRVWGIVPFGDFVARFAAELTPEVGPPFLTYIIFPTNACAKIRNDTLCPIEQAEIRSLLSKLGYQVE